MPPSRTSADSFGLTGPSDLPDPLTHAYRKDLADVALAGRVIASHYAEPLARTLLQAATLRSAPSVDAPVLADLAVGDPLLILDNSRGWAWGYAGPERRVGYVQAEAVRAD